MTYEDAIYYKLMLGVGISNDFDVWLNTQIEQEKPISKLVLDLFDCGENLNDKICVLNKYILAANTEQIDKQKVFSLVVNKFKNLYEKNPEQLKHITEQMYSVAVESGWNEDEPWYTMYRLDDYYHLAAEGIIKKEDFMNCFSLLIYQQKASNINY